MAKNVKVDNSSTVVLATQRTLCEKGLRDLSPEGKETLKKIAQGAEAVINGAYKANKESANAKTPGKEASITSTSTRKR